MREKNKKIKGITLIALVITIVVLIILTVISVIIGDTGIFLQASKSVIWKEITRSRRRIKFNIFRFNS